MSKDGLDLLNRIFTSSAEGMIIVDRKGHIMVVNPSARDMFGYSRGDMLGIKIEELIPNGLRAKHEKHRANYVKEPKSRRMGNNMDLLALKSNGETFPTEISLSYLKFNDEMLVVAFIVDITERKKSEEMVRKHREELENYAQNLEKRVWERTQELEHLNLGLQSQVQERKLAEKALEESQNLYRAIAKNFPNGVINVFDEQLNYVFVDGSLKQRTGNGSKDLIGTNYLLQFPEKDRDFAKKYLENAMDGEEVDFELKIGKDYYHFIATLLDESNVDVHLLVVEEKITEKKKAQEEIIKNLEREKELNELKSRFVSMASHEFRTPLSTILSSVSLINRYDDSKKEKRDRHVNRIKSSVQNLTSILNDFLSLEKLERGLIVTEKIDIRIGSFIKETVDEVSGVLKPEQVIRTSLPENGKEIYSDPKLLKNILLNLLSNASKYSESSSTIYLDVSAEEELRVSVKDEGIGIPEHEQKNLFQQFFRAGNVTNIQGTGLGLNIVKRYVDLLGGSITFKSKQNEGSTFNVIIPL